MDGKIRYIFFDIGYTLVDEEAVWKDRCRRQAQTAEAKGLSLTSEKIHREILAATLAGKPQYRTLVQKYHLTEVIPYDHTLEKLYPDAREVLETLSRHYKLGVIANQEDGLRERLGAWGIRAFFDTVISSWDHPVMKPDPQLFQIALRESGCAPGQCVMVGDRLDNDICPAKAIGMKTIWIRQGFGGHGQPKTEADMPDETVFSLRGLLDVL